MVVIAVDFKMSHSAIAMSDGYWNLHMSRLGLAIVLYVDGCALVPYILQVLRVGQFHTLMTYIYTSLLAAGDRLLVLDPRVHISVAILHVTRPIQGKN